MGDQPNARPIPIQDNITQKGEDKRLCLKPDSDPRSQHPSDQGLLLRPRGRLDRLTTIITINNNNNNNLSCEFSSVPVLKYKFRECGT
jgi:hypothetical protein